MVHIDIGLIQLIPYWLSIYIRLSPINRLLPLIWLDNPWIILQNLVLMMEIKMRVLRLIWALINGIVIPCRWLVTYIALCLPSILLLWILMIRHIWKVLGWSKRLLKRRIPSVVGKIWWNISVVVLVEIVVRQVLGRRDLVILSTELWLLVPRLLVLISSKWEILSSRI